MVKSASTLVLIPILTLATSLGCSSNDAIPTQESPVRSQQAAVTSDAGAVSATAASVTSVTDAGVSATELARIQAYLDARYTAKDVQHTFETKLGQTVDCIDFFLQPGVKEKAALGTPITQIPKPPPIPEGGSNSVPDWAYNGQPDKFGRARACPGNTVPMQHITVADILAAGGLDAFTHAQRPGSTVHCAAQHDGFAHVREVFNNQNNPNIYYADATLSVNVPQVPTYEQSHSVGQLWLVSGTTINTYCTSNCCTSDCMQTVEAGWQVINNHATPSFFIDDTNNGYNSNCNIGGLVGHCPIWLVYPGATLKVGDALPYSVPSGDQREIRIIIENFSSTWSVYAAGSWAGYFSTSDFFGTMQTAANTFSVGGEVSDSRDMWSTPMGSGADPGAGFGQAAYVHDMYACIHNGGCSYDFSIDCVSDLVPSYTYRTDLPAGALWANWFYYGDAPHAFWGANYGVTDWSPTNPKDWALNSYKAECGTQSSYGFGVPVTGISKATSGSQRPAQAVHCGPNGMSTTLANCHAIQFGQAINANNPTQGFLNEDVGQFPSTSGDWDPYYWKGECAANEFVSGVSQFAFAPYQGGLDRILCCPGSVTHANCGTQAFDSGNSPGFLTNSPDWDQGYYKGQCQSGQYVAGVSAIANGNYGVVGSAHALLCCSP